MQISDCTLSELIRQELVAFDNKEFIEVVEGFPPVTWVELMNKYLKRLGSKYRVTKAVDQGDDILWTILNHTK